MAPSPLFSFQRTLAAQADEGEETLEEAEEESEWDKRSARDLGRTTVFAKIPAFGLIGALVLAVTGTALALAWKAHAPAPYRSSAEAAVELMSKDRPSLFCFSVMRIGTPEETLLKEQLKRRASIFACNEYAVISSKAVALGNVSWGTVWTWKNPAPPVPTGRYGVNGQKTDSYLNTAIFIQAWGSLVKSGKLWKHDFVVKVDPDAVFMPDRLRAHVKDHSGECVYFTNCGGKLYGSVEVFSKSAIQKYKDGMGTCKNLPWQGWGEDYYMQHCLDVLGVHGIFDYNQVGDARCANAPCSDWTKAAFHPKKDLASYMSCWSEATGISL